MFEYRVFLGPYFRIPPGHIWQKSKHAIELMTIPNGATPSPSPNKLVCRHLSPPVILRI